MSRPNFLTPGRAKTEHQFPSFSLSLLSKTKDVEPRYAKESTKILLACARYDRGVKGDSQAIKSRFWKVPAV